MADSALLAQSRTCSCSSSNRVLAAPPLLLRASGHHRSRIAAPHARTAGSRDHRWLECNCPVSPRDSKIAVTSVTSHQAVPSGHEPFWRRGEHEARDDQRVHAGQLRVLLRGPRTHLPPHGRDRRRCPGQRLLLSVERLEQARGLPRSHQPGAPCGMRFAFMPLLTSAPASADRLGPQRTGLCPIPVFLSMG